MLTFLVAFAVLVTVASTSVFSLRLATQQENSQSAQRLANSIVHQAIANIVKAPDFAGELQMNTASGWARITFQRNLGLPYSTNNWEGDHPTGWQRGVPQGMVHLVAVAEVRGAQRRVEALVDMPVYPMTVACSGPLTLQQSTVASVKDEVLDEELDEILASPFLPANVGSNSPKALDSITLEPGSHVTGFVQSCGGIDNNGAQIDGEIRARWPEASELPDMAAAMLDPRRPDPSEENVIYSRLDPAASYGDLSVNAHNVVEGSLTVDGSLTLNDALLYVDGDLTVRGGLNGQGAIGVKGKVTVQGASHLRAQSRVAVVADGDIVLRGTSKARQRFEGILFGKGTIRVESITLLGSCIQNAPPGSPANQIGVVLDDANLLYANLPAGAAFNPPIDSLLPAMFGSAAIEDVKLSPSSREPDTLVGRTNIRRTRSGAPAGPGNQAELANNWGATDVTVLRMQFDKNGNPRFAFTIWGRNTTDNQPMRNPDGSPDMWGCFYDSLEGLLTAHNLGTGGPAGAVLARLAETEVQHAPGGLENMASIMATGQHHSGGYNEFGDGVNEAALRAQLSQTVNALLTRSQALRRRSRNSRGYFSMDPSRFLSRSRAVRLHYWREI